MAAWLAYSKLDLLKAIRQTRIDGLVKAAVCGALAGVDESDFNKYRDLLARVVSALAETENGRAILLEVGIDPASIASASASH